MYHFYYIKFNKNPHLTDEKILDYCSSRYQKYIVVREKWDTNPHWHILDLNLDERTEDAGKMHLKRKLDTYIYTAGCRVNTDLEASVSYILKEGNVIFQNLYSPHELTELILSSKSQHAEVEIKRAAKAGSFTAKCVESYVPTTQVGDSRKDHIGMHVMTCLDGNTKGVDKFIVVRIYYAIMNRHYPNDRYHMQREFLYDCYG